jgi:hypothetical protein
MTTKQTPHGKDHSETAASPKSAEVKSDVKDEEKPVEEKPQASAIDEIPHGLMAFARRHPVATVLGAAGIGLFGGIEIAAAMLVGAGVAAIVRGQSAPHAHVVREKARGVLARRPELKNRARAVVDAVRGRIHTNGHNA